MSTKEYQTPAMCINTEGAIMLETKRLQELLSMFLDRFPEGGFLHIVIKEGHWDTWSIVSCLMSWEKTCCDDDDLRWMKAHNSEIQEMCELILNLNEEERGKLFGYSSALREVDRILQKWSRSFGNHIERDGWHRKPAIVQDAAIENFRKEMDCVRAILGLGETQC